MEWGYLEYIRPLEYLERRIKALEEALAVHADLLQHYRLAAGI